MRFFRPAPPRVALAERGDAEELAALYARHWEGCRDLDSGLVEEQRVSLEDVRVWLGGGFEIYRAAHEGRPVAAVRCSFPTSTCHVDRLAVDPELRGRGFGHALVQHAIVRARRAGVSRVWTEASPGIPELVRLFEGLGFREAGRHRALAGGPLVLLELPI